MPFDFGAGLSKMGEDVGKVAGAGALEAQKSAAEQEKITLANQLAEGTATRGREQQGQIDLNRQSEENKFKSADTDKRLTSEEKRTGMTNDATRYTADQGVKGHQISADASRDVEHERAQTYRDIADVNNQTKVKIQDIKSAQVAEAKKYSMMSDDSIRTHAEVMMLNGGILPSGMGMGAVSYADKVRMDAKMNEMMKERGITPEQLVDQGFMAKQVGPAMAMLQKQQQAIGSFSAQADMLTERMVQQAKKLTDTGIPIANQSLRSLQQKFTNNKDLTDFVQTITALQIERAKILSGNMGNAAPTDAAQAHVNKMLNENMTFDSLQSGAKNLQIESDDRVKSISYMEKVLEAKRLGKSVESVDKPVGVTPENQNANPPGPMTKDGKIDLPALLNKKNAGKVFNFGTAGDWRVNEDGTNVKKVQ